MDLNFDFWMLAMDCSLRLSNAASNLLALAPKILAQTPCTLSKVASILVAEGCEPNLWVAESSVMLIAEMFPNTVIIEKETHVGYFLIFYHCEALMSLCGGGGGTGGTGGGPQKELTFSEKELLTTDSFLVNTLSNIVRLATSPTAVERENLQRLKKGIPEIPVTKICDSPSLADCMKAGKKDCKYKIHLERIVPPNGEDSDCSYLDTCFKGKQCKYAHYKVRYPQILPSMPENLNNSKIPAQYINANLLELDLGILGNEWKALILDPPWDIHTKPGAQGGCSDKDVLNLDVQKLQKNGIIFLWVTGRVLDFGRQCLAKWGYDHIEELLWLKTNQLGKTICTGRTGHWLNHTKEHVLVGRKGDLGKDSFHHLDSDVLVSSALGKSQKPEEIYGIIDRIVDADAKKLELFGRKSNIRPGWLTIGNELGSTRVVDSVLRKKLYG